MVRDKFAVLCGRSRLKAFEGMQGFAGAVSMGEASEEFPLSLSGLPDEVGMLLVQDGLAYIEHIAAHKEALSSLEVAFLNDAPSLDGGTFSAGGVRYMGFVSAATNANAILEVDRKLNILMSRYDTDQTLADDFSAERGSARYQQAFEKKKPLVTITVATYNRSELLVERCLKSLLAQSYENIQIVVVGDCCTDDTARRVAGLRDSRIVFENLSSRGDYPADPNQRWMVAGSAPFNRALELAEGDFIAHLDDDDEHLPERVEKLVGFSQANRLDVVWHPFLRVDPASGQWGENGAPHFAHGMVTTSSVIYHGWFKRLRADIDAFRLREPGDWNRFRKFLYLGATMMRYPEALLIHHPERSQLGR